MYRFMLPTKLGLMIVIMSIVFFNGCTIRSPAPTTPSTPGTNVPSTIYPPETTATYHTVQRGETLSIVAQMYGINSYQDLAAWNGIPPPYFINPGDRLLVSAPLGYTPSPARTNPVYTPPPVAQIPIPTTPPVTPPRPIIRSGGDYHTVQRGETLYRIAQAYGRNMAELAAWNHLSYPYTLSIGQSLRVTPPATSTVNVVKSNPTPTYSTPAYTGNDLRYHTVQQGDTLYNIAHRYQQEVADIARWNDLQPPYTLSLSQRLLVKPPGADEEINVQQTHNIAFIPTVSAAENTEKALYHSISAGDTLYSISQMYGYSVEEIAAWNGLHPPYNNLKVGQNLQVSPTTQKTLSSSQRKTVINIPDNTIQHVVKEGETVYSIAEHYGITAFDLSVWNGIGKPFTIFPGQKLKIVK